MTSPLGWGILGTGNIAGKFAEQLATAERGRLVAVGSRTRAAATAMAQRWNCRGHGSYADLLADDEVEAVYVSLPNALHHDWSLAALEAGKHVLCEKPLAATAAEAGEMFAAADRHGRTLVEAFMYRLHPAVIELLRLVHQERAIGQVKLVRSHFTFNRPARADDVRYQRDLAGGALMDIGCYAVNLIRALAGGEPRSLWAAAALHPSGVDEYAVAALEFDGPVLATLTCGMTVEADRTTFVGGSDGYLAIDSPWFSDGVIRLVREGREQVIRRGQKELLYRLEAEAFAKVVQDGEPPWITRDDSLGNLRTLDRLRECAGVTWS